MKYLLFIFFICFPFFSYTQEKERQTDILNVPLFFTEINPEHPAGIFSLSNPFYFFPGNEDSKKISFGYSMGNVWNPQVNIYFAHGMNEAQKNFAKNLSNTEKAFYFNFIEDSIEIKNKMYQADGVLEHFHFTYLRKRGKNSILFNINLQMLNGGKSPVNFFVSDNFLEWFHSNFAIDDNFGRNEFPYNEAFFEFDDENGNKYSKGRGDVFLTVSDIHYYRNLFYRKTSKSQFSLQTSGHLSIPLNSFHSYIIPGISMGLRYDFLSGVRNSFTLALDGAETFPCFFKTGRDMHFIDRKYREQINLYLGWNRFIKKNCYLNFGVLNNYQGSLIKNNSCEMEDEVEVSYLQEGDVWKGTIISSPFRLNKYSYNALYKPSCKTFFILGYNKIKGNSFHLYVGEDFFCYNNAPDFQVGFQYSFCINKKK